MERPIGAVTGATGGLGTALANLLAGQGYDLILQGRREPDLSAVRTNLISRHPQLNIKIVVGDLGTAAGTREVAAKFAADAPRLDLLVNNAGVLLDGIQMSPDHLEMHTQINLIAPYIMMQSLKENVSQTQGVIINISSGSGFRARDLSIKELTRPSIAKKLVGSYARSKLALSAVTQALGEEYARVDVTLASVGPGANKTAMSSGDGMPKLLQLLGPIIYAPPSKGAQRIVDAVEAARAHYQPGAFFTGHKAKELPAFAQSPKITEALLAFCETHAGLANPNAVPQEQQHDETAHI